MKNRNTGIFLSYINTGFNAVCGLILSSFLLKRLGDTEYGIYQTMASFANYLSMLQFGTGTIMTRNISLCHKNEREKIGKNLSTIWTITIIISLIIAIFSVAFYFMSDLIYTKSMTPTQIAYGKKILIIISIYLIEAFYTQTLNGFLLGNEQYTFSNILSISRTILRTIVLVLIIYNYKYSIAIAIIDVLIGSLVLIITFVYSKKRFNFSYNIKDFDKSIFKSMLPLCMAIFIQSIVNQANNNVDKFVISIELKPENVALYSVAMYIYSLFSSLTTIPITMYMPQIAKNIKSGFSKEKLTESLIQPCRLITFIGSTILFGFISFGKQFITMFYGASKLEAWIIAIIIMFPMLINMSNGIIINILDVYNKRIVRSLTLLFTTITNIILTILWIKKYGMIGAAIATCICTIIGQILLMNIYYYKYLKINIIYLFKKTFKNIMLPILIATLLSYLVGILIKNIFISFIVAVLVFLIIEFICLYIYGFNSEEKKQVSIIIKKIFKTK